MITKEIRTIRELEENLPVIRESCYIGGPITGISDYKKKFAEGQRFLRKYNIPVWNPSFHPDDAPYENYFPVCFAMIDVSRAVMLLPGWEDSKGACRELEYARQSEKPYLVLYYNDLRHDCLPESGNMPYGNLYHGIPVTRKPYEEIFAKLAAHVESLPNDRYENDIFRYRKYYWGDDDVSKRMNNFIFRPGNYHLRWYKYPLRDAFANRYASPEEFAKIIDACIASMQIPDKNNKE